MLPIWLLAAMMIMMYYWRFWEPWANAMLAILLPKLWFGLKIMTGTTVFACLPGALTGPKKASKRTVLHNRLNKEKTPGRCCQSGSLLLTAPFCSLLLLAAACCCLPAAVYLLLTARLLAENDAHPDSLHCDHHPRGHVFYSF